jgi:hypothetical protein
MDTFNKVKRSQYLVAAQCKPIDKLPEFHDTGSLYGPFDTKQEAIEWLDTYTNIRDNYSWTIVPGYVTGK